MIIYIIQLVLLLSLFFLKKSTLNKFFSNFSDFISLVIMSLIYGLRYDVGIDFFNYQNMFYDRINFYGNTDLLFDFFIDLFNLLELTFLHFNLFLGFLFFSLFYIVIKKYKLDFILSLFYFVLFGGMFISFNLVRQSIATLIGFISIFYFSNKSFFKFLISMTISILFHFSSIYIVFYLLIVNHINNKYKWFAIFSIGILLFISKPFSIISQFLPDSLSSIVESQVNVKMNIGFGVIFYFLLAVYLTFFLDNKSKYEAYFLMVSLFIFSYSFLLFFTQYLVFNRLTVFSQLALPFIFAKINDYKIFRHLNKIFNPIIISIFIIIFIYDLINISTIDSNNLEYNFAFIYSIFI